MTSDGTSALAIVPQEQAGGLYLKLARVMGELSRLEKGGKNTHFNYKYVTDSDVFDAVRPLLAQNGVAFVASIVSYEQEDVQVKNGTSIITRVHMQYRFIDGDTGQMSTHDWHGEALDNQDKGINKATKGALKYFLLNTFMISTGDVIEDPDSTGEEVQQRGQRQVQKASNGSTLPGWANQDMVDGLRRYWNGQGLSDLEIARLAGVSGLNAYAEWSTKYTDHRHASGSIQAALKAEMESLPPAPPKNKPAQEEPANLNELFPRDEQPNNNRMDAHITKTTIKRAKNGNLYFMCEFEEDIKDVSLFDTDLLIENHWRGLTDMPEGEQATYIPSIPVTLEKNKKGYYEVVRMMPRPEPVDDTPAPVVSNF